MTVYYLTTIEFNGCDRYSLYFRRRNKVKTCLSFTIRGFDSIDDLMWIYTPQDIKEIETVRNLTRFKSKKALLEYIKKLKLIEALKA